MDPNYNGTPGFSGDETKTTMIDPNSQNYYGQPDAPQQAQFTLRGNDEQQSDPYAQNQYQQPDPYAQNQYQQPDPFAQNQYQQPGPFAQQFQSSSAAVPAKSASSQTKLIAIIALAVLAVAIVALLISTSSSAAKYNGKYKCVELTYMGTTLNEEQIDASGEMGILTIKGSKCEFNGESGKIKIKGSEVTLTDASGDYDGSYDKETKTITLTIEGMTFKFKKQ